MYAALAATLRRTPRSWQLAAAPARQFSKKNSPSSTAKLSSANPLYLGRAPKSFTATNPLRKLPKARDLAKRDQEKLTRELEKEQEGEEVRREASKSLLHPCPARPPRPAAVAGVCAAAAARCRAHAADKPA